MKREILKFEKFLYEQERKQATVEKYIRDVRRFQGYMGTERKITKSRCLDYKQYLLEHYKPASVNSMLAALNCFLKYTGRSECCVRPVRIQRSIYEKPEQELRKEEYMRLLGTAKKEGQHRLALIMETICATGIRISELHFFTVSSVKEGKVTIYNKGKVREIFIPHKLKTKLLYYIRQNNICSGPVFITKGKKPVNRSNIWKAMKELAKKAKVKLEKVFPHNLRHLFAKTYYKSQKDIVRLADILGHSNVETTRIYTKSSGKEHRRQLESLNLIL